MLKKSNKLKIFLVVDEIEIEHIFISLHKYSVFNNKHHITLQVPLNKQINKNLFRQKEIKFL